MISTSPRFQPGRSVLVYAAHCDDAALGAGGLLRRLSAPALGLAITSIVFTGGDGPRRAEEEAAALALGVQDLRVLDLPDTGLPRHDEQIKSDMWATRDRIGADNIALVLCPRLEDRHQDHRTVAENVWRIFRDHLILEYEIAKYEGDLARPNLYVPLSADEAQAKADTLLRCYPSRAVHHWWQPHALQALMALRGIECNSPFAEAFVARKQVW